MIQVILIPWKNLGKIGIWYYCLPIYKHGVAFYLFGIFNLSQQCFIILQVYCYCIYFVKFISKYFAYVDTIANGIIIIIIIIFANGIIFKFIF